MTNSSNPDHNDDGRAWGWMQGGVWCAIPKGPLVRAALGPPPFDVTLAGSGEVRRVVHNPNGNDAPIVDAPKGISTTDALAIETPTEQFAEPDLPPFRVMRDPGDTDEGWEITSMEVARALRVPWPLP